MEIIAPPSSICTTNTTYAYLNNNQFIYSPTDQRYAAGMLNNQLGVYQANGYGSVTSTALWAAPQTATPTGAYFSIQNDRNLVIYAPSSPVLWASNTYLMPRAVYCLRMLDNGNLIYINASNSAVVPG